MKMRLILLCVLLGLLPLALMGQDDHGAKTFAVQAWDFSDPALEVSAGDPCAAVLAYLTGPAEKYSLLDATGVQGPPGVVYTLANYKGHLAVVKCGAITGGCGDGEDGEHEPEVH